MLSVVANRPRSGGRDGRESREGRAHLNLEVGLTFWLTFWRSGKEATKKKKKNSIHYTSNIWRSGPLFGGRAHFLEVGQGSNKKNFHPLYK